MNRSPNPKTRARINWIVEDILSLHPHETRPDGTIAVSVGSAKLEFRPFPWDPEGDLVSVKIEGKEGLPLVFNPGKPGEMHDTLMSIIKEAVG